MRLVETVLCRAIAAAFVDTGCTEDYARLMVQFGLLQSRRAARMVLPFVN